MDSKVIGMPECYHRGRIMEDKPGVIQISDLHFICQLLSIVAQCPRTDLNKRFLPRPNTITALKLIPQRFKICKNRNIPHWVHYIDFSQTDFYYIIENQLYSNHIQTHFT